MNTKRLILPALLSVFLTVGAVPAWAVSFNNTFSANRFNTVGSTFRNMTASNSTFCYLSSISIEETDTGGEEATCRVTRGPIVWTLEAILDSSNDADAECRAICYNNGLF